MNFKKLIENGMTVLKNNQADILIGSGVAMMWGAMCSAATGGEKAQAILDEKRKETLYEDEDGNTCWIEPSFKEKVKLTWKCYIEAAAIGTAGTAAIACGTVKNHKRISGLTAACALAEKTLADHKEELKNLVGEEKAAEVEKKVVEKQAAEVQPPERPEPDITGLREPRTLIWDEYLGRYFYAYPAEIKQVCDWINHELAMCTSFVSINEAFDHLNKISDDYDEIKPVGAGRHTGWSLSLYKESNEFITFKLSGSDELTPRGQAYAVLHYTRPEPFTTERTMW